MVSKTIDQGLKAYGVGEKLRALRLKKSMGLVELGKHTGLSPALLSKLERGKLFPTLPTLLRISMVFSVGLDFFFGDERRRHVVALVRRSERQRFPERPGARDAAFYFESLDFPALERKLNAYYAEFNPVPEGKGQPHQHGGAEFIYLLEGKLSLKIRDDKYVLEAGDSIYFDCSVPHSYHRIGKNICSALVVTVP
jgi:transcriptional regulator with XRE-family HTH domain